MTRTLPNKLGVAPHSPLLALCKNAEQVKQRLPGLTVACHDRL
nr:MAG TPA: hypothetical protein [Caudoviricetes sp.]